MAPPQRTRDTDGTKGAPGRSRFAPEPRKSGGPLFRYRYLIAAVLAVNLLVGLTVFLYVQQRVVDPLADALNEQSGAAQGDPAGASAGVALSPEQQEVVESGSVQEQNEVYESVFLEGMQKAVDDFATGETATIDMSDFSSDPAVSEEMMSVFEALAERAGEEGLLAAGDVGMMVCGAEAVPTNTGACAGTATEFVGSDSGEVELMVQLRSPYDDLFAPTRDYYQKYEAGFTVSVVDGAAALVAAG